MGDQNVVKIIEIEKLNHNVRRYRTEKPSSYSFESGQATDVAINENVFDEKFRPFTFTSLNTDNYLEFVIKSYLLDKYPSHSGVTEKMNELKKGDELIIKEPFGSIKYKEKGLFLAGGTGITPFYAIFKDLYSKNKIDGNRLIFSNSSRKDIFLETELLGMLGGDNVVFTLTKEKSDNYEYGRINKSLIQKFNDSIDYYYVCGPLSFQDDIINILNDLNVPKENIIIESW